MPDPRLHFFLGGRDLEMVTIRDLLERRGVGRFDDKELGWGAKTSDYEAEIFRALNQGETPVLVELEDDLELPLSSDGTAKPGEAILVDHHGRRAGSEAPTSLHQVSELIGLDPANWDRWYHLVAANDRGYLQELRKLGATQNEMRRVREADWKAQGITRSEIEAAGRAAGALDARAGGRLLVARLPHARTAPLVDRLHQELGGPGFETLLVQSPGEVNAFAPGPVILALDRAFPGGWYGGALPKEGYWGHSGHPEGLDEFLLDQAGKRDG